MGKKSVSKEVRDQIIGLHIGSHSTAEIAKILGCVSISCVRKTIIRYEETGSTLERSRSGRPRKTTTRDDNHIFRTARKEPTKSCEQIAKEMNLFLQNIKFLIKLALTIYICIHHHVISC